MSFFFRKTIKIPLVYNIILLVLFYPIGFFIIYSLGKQVMVLHDREIKYFIKKETNGIIVGIDDQGRNGCSITVRTKKAFYVMPYQALDNEAHDLVVQMGDSISKAANSRDVTFYRKEKGVHKKYWSLRVQTYTD